MRPNLKPHQIFLFLFWAATVVAMVAHLGWMLIKKLLA